MSLPSGTMRADVNQGARVQPIAARRGASSRRAEGSSAREETTRAIVHQDDVPNSKSCDNSANSKRLFR